MGKRREHGEGVERHRQWASVRGGPSEGGRSSFKRVSMPERSRRAEHLAALLPPGRIRFTGSPGPLRNLPMLIRAPGCSICWRTTLNTFLDLPVSPLPVPSDDMTPPCEHFDGCDSVIISFWSSQASIFAGIGPVCAARHARSGRRPPGDSNPTRALAAGPALRREKSVKTPLGPETEGQRGARRAWTAPTTPHA